MNKHTPGPWQYFHWEDSKPHLWTIGSRHTENGPDHIITQVEISEADARLIAAAPELLSILKRIRLADNSQTHRKSGKKFSYHEENCPCEICAVIDKAEAKGGL